MTSLPPQANILIDENCNARLADFGLLIIVSDPGNLLSSSSNSQRGTVRWMSPELILPQEFGFENSRPTGPSDCYALGMVIYETISGNLPFHEDVDYAISLKVVEGERPPRGAKFTNRLWEMLKLCWAPQPNDRPSVEAVLQCLRVASNLLESPSPGSDEEADTDDWDSSDGSSVVQNGTSYTMVTESGVPTPPGSSHATDFMSGSVLPGPRLPIIKVVDEKATIVNNDTSNNLERFSEKALPTFGADHPQLVDSLF